MDRFFDASGVVAGRLASNTAKQLLRGDKVTVVNAEKALVSGDKVYTENLFKEKVERGEPYHGPFYPKEPDRMLRRMVRGMLPFHTARGREAFRRLRVYKSIPAELKGRKFERPDIKSRLTAKKMEIGEISVKLGVKKNW
jgi:large subunit ribosomal protein L13